MTQPSSLENLLPATQSFLATLLNTINTAAIHWRLKKIKGAHSISRIESVKKVLTGISLDFYRDKNYLLYKNHEARGILVFEKELTNEYSMKAALKVKTFSPLEIAQEAEESLLKALLSYVEDEAMDEQAQSLIITIPKVRVVITVFLINQGFQLVNEELQVYILGRIFAEKDRTHSNTKVEAVPVESSETSQRNGAHHELSVHPAEPDLKKARREDPFCSESKSNYSHLKSERLESDRALQSSSFKKHGSYSSAPHKDSNQYRGNHYHSKRSADSRSLKVQEFSSHDRV